MTRVVEINEYDRFLDLKETWNNVLDRSQNRNIFLTWEWLSTWWKYFGRGRRLILLLVEDDNGVIAIAPLMYSKYRLFLFELRKIEFVGTGITDYHDFILAGKENESLRILLDYIKGHAIKWDCIELEGIPEPAKSAVLMQKEFHDLGPSKRISDICPYIRLPDSFEAFMRRLSSNTRRQLRRRSRKLEREYKVEFQKCSDFHSINEAMHAFFDLHRKRWKSKGFSGEPVIRQMNARREFYLEIANLFAENEWLNLLFLTIDGKPISVHFSFEYDQKLYHYLTAFDPKYSKYGPGNIALMHLIEDCIQNQVKEVDFVRGAEAYKYQMGAADRRTVEVSIVRRRFLPRIFTRIASNRDFIRRKLRNSLALKEKESAFVESI